MVDADCPGAPTWVAGENYPQGTVVKHSDGKCYEKANNEFAEPIIQTQNVCDWSDGDTVTISTTGSFGLPVIADFTVDIIMDCSSWSGSSRWEPCPMQTSRLLLLMRAAPTLPTLLRPTHQRENSGHNFKRGVCLERICHHRRWWRFRQSAQWRRIRRWFVCDNLPLGRPQRTW